MRTLPQCSTYKVYDQPRDTRIEIPIPQLIDDETWERAQKVKTQRSSKAKRNTKVLYLLQHLLKCGECGHNFHARSTWTTTSVRNSKKYQYDLPTPHRYYMCTGMQSLRLRCRERPYIRAERLEEPIWREVKRVIQNPEQRKEILQMVVEEVIVDRNDNVDITLAIPIESEPTTEDSVYVQTLESLP